MRRLLIGQSGRWRDQYGCGDWPGLWAAVRGPSKGGSFARHHEDQEVQIDLTLDCAATDIVLEIALAVFGIDYVSLGSTFSAKVTSVLVVPPVLFLWRPPEVELKRKDAAKS